MHVWKSLPQRPQTQNYFSAASPNRELITQEADVNRALSGLHDMYKDLVHGLRQNLT